MMKTAKLTMMVALILCFAMVMGCAPAAAPAAPAPEAPAAEPAPAAEAPTPAAEEPQVTEAEKTYRVGMILSGPITDVSWNGPQYNGLLEIEAGGAKIAYQESISVSDVADALYTYCDEGFDAIFLSTNYYEETALPIMAEYPDITFFIINGTTTKDNVYSFQVADEQQGFMMGVVSALASQKKNVGFVGGREITPILNGKIGFEQGVAYVNNGVSANTTMTGTNEDVTANKETAKAIIDAGADVVAPMCDNSALGVVEAAQEAGVFAVASGIGQEEVAPDAVLIAVVKNNGIAVKAAYDAFASGTLGNETLKLGAAEGVIYLSDWYTPADSLSEDVKAQVKSVYDDLCAGKIQIDLG